MDSVLIVDYSHDRDTLADILKDKGYTVVLCESAFDAMAQLKSHDYDLVISEVELPGDNAFDLYYYIQKNYPYIPMIMTTSKNIDSYFNNIFEQGIGNVLRKPIKKDELLNLAQKLISNKNVFGLENYVTGMIDQKKISITASSQIPRAVSLVISEIEAWGFIQKNKMLLNLILNEVAINAVYHSHGLTKEKEKRIPVTLSDGDHVDIFFARGAKNYGISIVDYKGILTKNRILESLHKMIEQGNLIEQAYETGEDISPMISETGRGFDLVRKLSGEYYFIIKQNERTEVMLLFEPDNDRPCETSASLKIIEVR